MVKLKMLSMHNLDNVPDHLIQEIQDLSIKLTLNTLPQIENAQPNVALGALNWMIPVMIKYLVVNNPDELRKAAKMSCKMLLSNMEILINQMEKE